MMIDIDRGNGIEQMEESELRKRWGTVEDDHEQTQWTEYWLGGRLVHRSAHVHLKQGLDLTGSQGTFSG